MAFSPPSIAVKAGRLFPAYAGVIPMRTCKNFGNASFPRTCGGDPDAVFKAEVTNNFSPHTRG